MKHLRRIHKKYTSNKYALGLFLLLVVIVFVLFFRSKTVVAPQEEVSDTSSMQKAIDRDWRCPANAWVNCGPGSESKECDKEYLEWALSQCQGFQGAAY